MKTPLELLLNEVPDYTFLKVFGCARWPHLRPYNQRKLEFRSKQCVFLGYSSLHKGYKCLHVPSNRVYISRDVVFDENIFPFFVLPVTSTTPTTPEKSVLPLPGQFVDAAYTPLLLPNHGAGTGRGARLELLDEQPPASPQTSAEPARDAAPSPGLPTGLAEPGPATSVQLGAGHIPAEPVELAEPVSPEPASPPALAEPTSMPSSPGRSPGATGSASGEWSASSLPSSSTSSPPSPPPPPAIVRPSTRSQSGIVRPKERTDGTVAWIATCMAQADADPTAEPRHFQAALRIPHWRSAMEQEFQALQRNDT